MGEIDKIFRPNKGLPRDCFEETYNTIKPIFKKYLEMKKPHMNKDRITGIMYEGFIEAVRKSIREENKGE